MGPQHLIDTNVVIDFFNGRLPISGQRLLATTVPAISVITHIELFSKARLSSAEIAQMQQFVQVAIVYGTITADIIEQTTALRVQHKIKTPDAIIAATALVYDLTLITRNISDFRAIQGIKLIDPHNL